jgi:hypothetical protein
MTYARQRFLLPLLPCLACLLVFWPGLSTWFMQDDFAWLGLRLQVHDASTLLDALLAPKAQGTIRPWSERVFFMGLSSIFGMEALPFRIVVFATQMLAMVLVSRLTLRITGSRLAAFWAPALWGVNAALGVPLSWTSAYNQILCAAMITGAMLLFVRWVQTGDPRFYLGQWIVFLLAFGALELNVVYPALAGVYALLSAPSRFRAVVPMGVVSVVYAVVHRSLAPEQKAGPYALHFGPAMFSKLGSYWVESFGGTRLRGLDAPLWLEQLGAAAPAVLTLGLAIFLVAKLRQDDKLVLFPLAWFGLLIAPVLALRDHFAEYYLAVPTMGLAMLGGWALSEAWHSGWLWRLASLVLAAWYIITTAPLGYAVASFNLERSAEVENLVRGVERIHQLHPDKMILLSGIDSQLYWAGINDSPYRLLGISSVFLVPGSEDTIEAHPDLGDVSKFVFPSGRILSALEERRAVVYAFEGARLRNITQGFTVMAKSRWKPELARRVDAGNPEFADQLGPGWHPAEQGYRWMSKQAVVWLAGPSKPGTRVHVEGFCPESQIAQGPLQLTISLEGKPFPPHAISRADAFAWDAELGPELVGRDRIELRLEVDRTTSPPGDGRQLGLAFGSFSIR